MHNEQERKILFKIRTVAYWKQCLISLRARSCLIQDESRNMNAHYIRNLVQWWLLCSFFRYTPLDYALLGEHHEVIQFMLEHGALSIAAIQDIAAFKIQAVYKGYKVRKAFQERKNLLMKHEQLRKDAAAK